MARAYAPYTAVPAGCPLSNRQFEVMSMLAEGRTHAQIAWTLRVSESTSRSLASTSYGALGFAGAGGRGPAIVAMKDSGWLGAPPRGPRQPHGRGTPVQRAYLHCWDRLTHERTAEAAEILRGAAHMLLGEHDVTPAHRPKHRPDIDELLLSMARALLRPIAL